MQDLHDALWNLTVEDLKTRLQLLETKPKSQRKADLIEAHLKALTGSNLAKTYQSLTPLQQLALADACHSIDLSYHPARITAKHGECPPLIIKTDRWSYSGTPTALSLFFFYSRSQPGHLMPSDLADALREIIPEPAPLEISTVASPPDEQGLSLRHTESDALREIATLLRLAEQGKLRTTAKTGMPAASSLGTLRDSLSSGDFFPPEVAHNPQKNAWEEDIGDIKPIGWTRLLLAGKLITSGTSKATLTKTGLKALAQPRHEVIRQLWQKWLANNEFDEFNRIEAILGQRSKGHMTAKPARRQAINQALQECPANQWITLQTFSTYMKAEDLHFEITHSPWKLYLCEQKYGNFGYDGSGTWEHLQLRYILALLFEHAATLGLIDIAYRHPTDALPDYRDLWGADDLSWLSRYDGLRAFRINNLGAYCLGLRDEYQESTSTTSVRLQAHPNLTLQLLSDTIPHAESLLLETWAEPTGPSTWHLDPLRARDAIERGNNPADFLDFLAQGDDQPVPQSIEAFLKTAQSDGQALKHNGQAHLFDCRDRQTTEMILANKTLAKLCSRCGDSQLVVLEKNMGKFKTQIRSLGLGII